MRSDPTPAPALIVPICDAEGHEGAAASWRALRVAATAMAASEHSPTPAIVALRPGGSSTERRVSSRSPSARLMVSSNGECEAALLLGVPALTAESEGALGPKEQGPPSIPEPIETSGWVVVSWPAQAVNVAVAVYRRSARESRAGWRARRAGAGQGSRPEARGTSRDLAQSWL